jgi:hypothetical protein
MGNREVFKRTNALKVRSDRNKGPVQAGIVEIDKNNIKRREL